MVTIISRWFAQCNSGDRYRQAAATSSSIKSCDSPDAVVEFGCSGDVCFYNGTSLSRLSSVDASNETRINRHVE